MLATLTFSIKGCGNFQNAEIELEDNPDLKIFSPEITSSVSVTPKGYCGTKTYKFMLKGLRRGETSLKLKPFEFFSRENGWQAPDLTEIKVNVREIGAGEDSVQEREAHSFELLKELPANVKKYEISPLTEKKWFRLAILIPFAIVLLAFIFRMKVKMRSYRALSTGAKMNKWKNKIINSKDSTELLNSFYDALEDLYGIKIKGERINSLKQKYGEKTDRITDFIRTVEEISYSGISGADISSLKEDAIKLLDPRGFAK